MMRMLWITAIVALLLGAAAPVLAGVGNDASWWTVDGGGAYASAGDYTLGATAGQPDAATVAAHWYELRGGYWPGAVVRRPRNYLPLGAGGYLEIEHMVDYGQLTIVALGLLLIGVWRAKGKGAVAA